MYSGRLINKVLAMTIPNLLAPRLRFQQGAFLSCVWVGKGSFPSAHVQG